MLRKVVAVPIIVSIAVAFCAVCPGLVYAKSYKPVQEVDMLLTKVMERLTIQTQWGNVYFNNKDIKKIVHGAAKLRPVALGRFVTDAGSTVHIKVARISRSVVTFHIWP